jgi:UDP-GlcNAc:undecaprenyl-phosphate/decaprenyl-phosphate GlcNAc-1-phosphate transferase
MGSLLWTSAVTFVASLCLTVAVRGMARRRNIVDRPDGQRKLHDRPVPLLGGVAVYGAAVLGLVAVQFTAGATVKFNELSIAWLTAAGFVCFVGSVDDCFNLPSRVKLALQILSVLPIVLLGYSVDRIVAFGYPIALGWLGVPLTVFWLVGCINALNLIDGMDGLASIVGLSTAAMLGVIAASQGQEHVAMMAIVLTAALAGFLIYNLPPASIFLGDSGSMVIGLTVGVLGIQGALKTSATLAITAPAVVMTLPMFDIVAALVRRRLTGRRFDSPDRLHIHHRLLERGWTPWQVLCLMGALCLTMGAAATAATIFRRDALAWIAAMSLVVLMIRLRLFGHDEFSLAKHAAVRAVRSCTGFLAQLARSTRVQVSRFMVPNWSAAADRIPIPVLQTLAPDSWDRLLRSLRPWNVRQVEFCSLRGKQQRRIRWIDPAAAADGPFRWSLSV